MSSDDLLDQVPLELLMALRDAVADPSEEGRKRAAERAKGAGVYLHCAKSIERDPSPPRVLREPIPMVPAPAGVDAEQLDFSSGPAGSPKPSATDDL